MQRRSARPCRTWPRGVRNQSLISPPHSRKMATLPASRHAPRLPRNSGSRSLPTNLLVQLSLRIAEVSTKQPMVRFDVGVRQLDVKHRAAIICIHPYPPCTGGGPNISSAPTLNAPSPDPSEIGRQTRPIDKCSAARAESLGGRAVHAEHHYDEAPPLVPGAAAQVPQAARPAAHTLTRCKQPTITMPLPRECDEELV